MADEKISAMTPAATLDGTEIVPVVQGGANVRTTTADIAAAPSLRRTLEITGDVSLLAASNGLDLYVVSGTSTDIDITVPAGLGDGFTISVFHQGSGALLFIGSGVTVEPPPLGTLALSQGMYASLQVFGADALVKLIGTTVAA